MPSRLPASGRCVPVDERLIPINGLIALLRGDGGWPKPLGQQGFRRHQLEVPVSTPLGNIRVDALVYRREPDLIVLSEAKSGRNLECDQAKKYLAVDSSWLRRAGAIPPELRPVRDPAVCTLFVGREEHRSDLETGLEHLGISAPLLTVGSGRARLTGSSDVSGLDPFDESHHAGLPPARIPVDHQSSDEDLMELLLPQIVAAQSAEEDIVSVEAIAERILPEWVVLSHGIREAFLKRLAALLQGLAAREMRGQFRYESLRQPHTRGRVLIEATPASRDPRGRTQAWQAQQRHAASALKRRQAQEEAGQLSLDELAEQGGLAQE